MASMLTQLQSWFGIAGTESLPPTMSPIILPTCPPSYNYFTTYQTGSTMSSSSTSSSPDEQQTIYKCQYQKYCNIFTPSKHWNETEYTYWNEAWVEIGPCLVREITDEPTTQPSSLSPTLITNKPTNIPICPAPYNSTRTNYLPNEKIEVHSNILICQEEYVKYCNIHIVDRNWNTEEREKWNVAWKFVGPCLKEEGSEVEKEEVGEEKVDESVDEGLIPSLPVIVYTDNPTKRSSLRPTTLPSSRSPISATPTESPSQRPSTESPTSMSPSYNPTPLQYCPPPYNPRYAKRNKYNVGDIISINNYIYQCRAGSLHPGSDEPYDLYETYCNMNNEDVVNLTKDEKRLYDLAWKPISYCYVTDTPTLLPTITPSSSPTTDSPSRMPTDEPSPRPSSHPTTQPTNHPSLQPSDIPSLSPTIRSITRSPIGTRWYPDVESNIKQCIYGNDYPEFMILNSNRNNFLFDTEETCCEYHSCIVKKVAEGEDEGKKREYWYPNVTSNDRECIYNSDYPNWMTLSTNRPNFIFTSQEECCIQHDCPIKKISSEYWYPNLLSTNEDRECIHDSSYSDWMTLEVNAPNFLFESEEECCIKHDCIKEEYWYLDIESSTNECKHGSDFPEWMSLEVNAPKFLFQSQQECCIEHECKSMYWFPEVYTDVKECIYSNQYPEWMTFRSSHYLFTSEMACCEVHECEERYWYPNLLSNSDIKDCLYDSNFEPWMASASNSHVFLFDSREGCCNRHGCDADELGVGASSPYRPYRNTPMPSRLPSRQPSRLPTRQPSRKPSRLPTREPSRRPSSHPTKQPSQRPSHKPTQRPSSSPTPRPQQLQACPDRYDSSTASTYTAGSQVEVNSRMYQCRGSLYSFYCSKTMYQPQSSSTPLWIEAWEDLGPCSSN